MCSSDLASTLISWSEEEKFSRIVNQEELAKNDYNISPSRYIHTSDAETYRPIAEIVKDLDAIEAEAREADRALREILGRLGVRAGAYPRHHWLTPAILKP